MQFSNVYSFIKSTCIESILKQQANSLFPASFPILYTFLKREKDALFSYTKDATKSKCPTKEYLKIFISAEPPWLGKRNSHPVFTSKRNITSNILLLWLICIKMYSIYTCYFDQLWTNNNYDDNSIQKNFVLKLRDLES